MVCWSYANCSVRCCHCGSFALGARALSQSGSGRYWSSQCCCLLIVSDTVTCGPAIHNTVSYGPAMLYVLLWVAVQPLGLAPPWVTIAAPRAGDGRAPYRSP